MAEANRESSPEGQAGHEEEDLQKQDLDLLDESLEDAGKDDAAIWDDWEERDLQSQPGKAAAEEPEAVSPEEKGEAGEGDQSAAETEKGDQNQKAAGKGQDDDSSRQKSGQSAGAKPGDAGAPPGEDKIWEGATPEQRAAYDAAQQELRRLQQADRSNRGRLSALQRQLNDVSRRAPSKEAGESVQQKLDEALKGDASAEDLETYLESEEWAQFKEEYPEVAGPHEKILRLTASSLKRHERDLQSIEQDRETSVLNEQEELLSQEHTDWQDVTADQRFPEWLGQQPRHVQEAAQRNSEAIVDAYEAADVVSRFKSHLNESQQQGAGTSNQRQQQGHQGQKDTGGGKQPLSGRRQQQLESASGTKATGPGAASGIPEDGDPEQIWKQFDEEERRQQARG